MTVDRTRCAACGRRGKARPCDSIMLKQQLRTQFGQCMASEKNVEVALSLQTKQQGPRRVFYSFHPTSRRPMLYDRLQIVNKKILFDEPSTRGSSSAGPVVACNRKTNHVYINAVLPQAVGSMMPGVPHILSLGQQISPFAHSGMASTHSAKVVTEMATVRANIVCRRTTNAYIGYCMCAGFGRLGHNHNAPLITVDSLWNVLCNSRPRKNPLFGQGRDDASHAAKP